VLTLPMARTAVRRRPEPVGLSVGAGYVDGVTADRATVAVRAAEAGAAVAEAAFRGDLTVETKSGDTDVVTAADREAQAAVVQRIRESFPDDAVVGEEEGQASTVPEEGTAWVIDPIDGTNNFVRGMRLYATSVAVVEDGEPVAAANVLPSLGDTYVADRESARRNGEPISVSDRRDPSGAVVAPTIWWDFDRREEYGRATTAIVERFADMRRIGCAQAALSLVADGAIEGVLTNVDPNPWDSIAGVHLVRNAGGTVTDLSGDRWTHDATGLVASNGHVHDAVLSAAREIAPSTDR
jgi:myo-inositol-1(or 4)-monophosphatase